ncbi:MAG: cardiolipin synthase, partial [Bacteroidetes bacterium]|nr:cardiolipin synthase [Bacteroidota bacterium]
MQTAGSSYKLYDDPWKFYDAMLYDIEQAKKYVYIETYKFGSGNIGERFKNVLTAKAKQGVEIKLLIDSWGTSVSASFFEEMI